MPPGYRPSRPGCEAAWRCPGVDRRAARRRRSPADRIPSARPADVRGRRARPQDRRSLACGERASSRPATIARPIRGRRRRRPSIPGGRADPRGPRPLGSGSPASRASARAAMLTATECRQRRTIISAAALPGPATGHQGALAMIFNGLNRHRRACNRLRPPRIELQNRPRLARLWDVVPLVVGLFRKRTQDCASSRCARGRPLEPPDAVTQDPRVLCET